MVPLGEDYPEIRAGVRAICAKYPGEYWRKLEKNDEYADAFVNELTAAGYLGALIPEEYGGAGLPLRAGCVILEEIHASGCSAAACHAQMYMMGTLLRHGSEEQKRRYLPGIATGEIRFQAFGVTEPTTGSDTTQLKTRAVRDGDHYVVNGQKVWTSRAHKSDLMMLLVRTTPVEEVKRRTEGLSVLLVDMRDALGQGLTIRRIDTMINHQTNEVFFDDLQGPGRKPDRRGRPGLPLHPRRHERRAHPDRRRVASAMRAISSTRASKYASERVVFGRPIGQNQGIQFPIARAYAEWKAADLLTRAAAALFEAGRAVRRGGQHRKAARLGSRLARRRSLHADLRRLCGGARIRHRAQVARGAHLSDRADLDQPDPRLYRPARAGMPRSY